MEILLSPPWAPRANAICERAVGTLRREILDAILIYNEAHAAQVLTEYIHHYNGHRPHQSRRQLPRQRRTTRPGHRHRLPGSPDPTTIHPRRIDQRVRARRLTERHRRSSQRRTVFSSGTGSSRCGSGPRRRCGCGCASCRAR
ncbi:integrase core domain-containing protein [Streptomyces sp. CA-106131]|uniref:integrase core domain-containing protein n=1 Tax=Streptomyces sp. CA-106131 TaxID=3240045 RepID=UPI003D8C5A5D